jgi:hypothetical protein
MPSRRRRSSSALAAQTSQLALAVPQVVAHRLTRMALAGNKPSARDRREFHRMGAEKIAAFQESWLAMYAEAWRLNQEAVFKAMQSLWMPWLAASRRGTPLQQWQRAALGVLGQGMSPVRRRAVANAKRLGRTRRR